MPHSGKAKSSAAQTFRGELEALGLLVKMQVPNEQVRGGA